MERNPRSFFSHHSSNADIRSVTFAVSVVASSCLSLIVVTSMRAEGMHCARRGSTDSGGGAIGPLSMGLRSLCIVIADPGEIGDLGPVKPNLASVGVEGLATLVNESSKSAFEFHGLRRAENSHGYPLGVGSDGVYENSEFVARRSKNRLAHSAHDAYKPASQGALLSKLVPSERSKQKSTASTTTVNATYMGNVDDTPVSAHKALSKKNPAGMTK